MRPILSVAVCARDDRHRLALCLEGLVLQAEENIEVLVVNDGGPSLDDVLAPFETRLVLRTDYLDPPSDAFRLSAARNRALQRARSDRILFLDQDCVVAPGLLKAHAEYGGKPVVVAGIRKHLSENEVASLGPADLAHLEGRTLRPDERMNCEHFREASGRSLPMSPTWVTGCHVSVPASLLRAIGGYWEAFVGWGYEDLEMALRLGRAGCLLEVRTDLVVVHLDHPSRINMWKLRSNRVLLARTESDPTIITRAPPLESLS